MSQHHPLALKPQSPASPLLPPEAPRWVHQCPHPPWHGAAPSVLAPAARAKTEAWGDVHGTEVRRRRNRGQHHPAFTKLPPPPVRFSAEGLKAQ